MERVYHNKKHVGYIEYDVRYPLGPVWWGKSLDNRYIDLGSKERAKKSVVEKYKEFLSKQKKKR